MQSPGGNGRASAPLDVPALLAAASSASRFSTNKRTSAPNLGADVKLISATEYLESGAMDELERAKFKMKRPNTSYNAVYRSKITQMDGRESEWRSKFSKPLDVLLYPSLQLVEPPAPVDRSKKGKRMTSTSTLPEASEPYVVPPLEELRTPPVKWELFVTDKRREAKEKKVEIVNEAKGEAYLRGKMVEHFNKFKHDREIQRKKSVVVDQIAFSGNNRRASSSMMARRTSMVNEPQRRAQLTASEFKSLNTPEALFKTLRISLEKKKEAQAALLEDNNRDDAEAHMNEDAIFEREKYFVDDLIGRENAHTAEGLLFYRYRNALEEARVVDDDSSEDRGMEMRGYQGKDLREGSFGSIGSGSPFRGGSSSFGDDGSQSMRSSKSNNQYTVQGGRIESDSSLVNLSKLRRAVRSMQTDVDIKILNDDLGSLASFDAASNDSVSGTTRNAQDALMYAQLRAGVMPEFFIKRSPNLEFVDIDLTKYSIGDVHGECLGRSLADFHTLQKLILPENRLTGNSVPTIMRNLSTHSVTFLNLAGNSLHIAGASAIGDFLMGVNVLRVLNLSFCGLDCIDVQTLCRAINKKTDSALREIDLSSNKIAVDGAGAIANTLSLPTCTISNLNLAWNDLGTQGAISIARALSNNRSLAQLDLSANCISDQGGQALAASLAPSKNSTLVVLKLSQNMICGGSCFVFSGNVKAHPALKKLDLSRNPVGEAGARCLYRTILRGLSCFIIMQSCSYLVDEKIFNYFNPSVDSPYELDLNEPYRAAVLRELLIMASEDPVSCRFGKVVHRDSKNGLETELALESRNGKIVLRGTRERWEPPTVGTLTVHFYSSMVVPTIDRAISKNALELIMIIVKSAQEEDRTDYLKLMCSDIYCTTVQAQTMIKRFTDQRILGSGGLRKIDIVSW